MNAQPAACIPVSGRIHLSVPHAGDKAAFVEYLNDREIYERTLRIPFPYGDADADADAFLQIVAEATASHGHPIHFAVRDNSGKAIGGCGFDGLRYGHRAEIGYWLARPFWGRGIMTDVVGALCQFVCSEWKLVRIAAHVFSANAASARVLEKNGFEFEGLLRKHRRKDGRFIDSRLYALVQ